MQEPSLTILILTCDAYKEIWDPTFFYFRKNWPDCPYPVYFVSDKKTTYQRKGVTVLSFEGKDFGGRVFSALQQVKTPYVLFLQEEYWLTRKVKTEKIQYLLGLMESKNISYLRLQMYQRLQLGKKIGKKVRSYSVERVFDIDNHPFLAKKDVLLKMAEGNDEAHVFERRLSKRAAALEIKAAVSKPSYFAYQEALVRGLFFRKAFRMAIKSECYHGKRRQMTRWEETKFYIHRILRDDCPRFLFNIIRKKAHAKGKLLAGEEPEDLNR
jgi:hypothetical protein